MTEKYREISVTRDEVIAAKQNGYESLAQLIKSVSNSGDLVFILENIGSLPPTYGRDCFIELLSHENKSVRFWAVKNLGKLKSLELLPRFSDIVENDDSTEVKREAVSSIGRMRTEETIPTLITVLGNADPKVVCQAIRGLLVFKGNETVDENLKKLINHENEMVVSVIRKEYFANTTKTKAGLPHAETYPFLVNVVVNGDVRDVLKNVPEESVHLTFTLSFPDLG